MEFKSMALIRHIKIRLKVLGRIYGLMGDMLNFIQD
jgi:hypothetical protein